jgi:hypothetical protein
MLEDPDLDRPSVFGPTLITALVAGIVFAVPVVVRGAGAESCCMVDCCTGATGVLLGALPPLLYRRNGGWMRAGTGFLCGLLAVGIGALFGAIVVRVLAPTDLEAMRALFGETYRAMPPESRPRMTEEEFVALLSNVVPYWPVFTIVMWSFWAGIVGLVTAGLVRRSPPPPAPLQQM